MAESAFKFCNVLCEYSMSMPSAIDRLLYPNLRLQIPTFHIFGVTPEGKKACVHVHGVLPYVLLRIGADFNPTLGLLMEDKINRLIQREMAPREQKTDRRQNINSYVFKIEPVMRKSIYGYHEEDEPFAKIYFYNPMHRAKLLSSLAREVDEFPIMQPFEAHTPFILQFFIDYSIFGMDEISLRRVQYRISPNSDSQETIIDGVVVGDVLNSPSLLSPLMPITSCAVECDAFVTDIMNKELHSFNVHSSNPGLEYIWREEAARCNAQGRKLEDVFNNYTPRPYWKIQSERDLLERLESIAKEMIEEKGEAILTQPLNNTILDNDSFNNREQNLDSTMVWTGEVTQLEESMDIEAPAVEPKEAGLDESYEDEADTVAKEEVLMTQLKDSLKRKYEEDKEVPDIEEFFCEDEPTPEPSEQLINSRWVTMDIDLPLERRVKQSTGTEASGSFPSDTTSVFADASFHPMPMNSSLEKTAVLNVSSNGDGERMEDDLSGISCLSAASLELLVFTQASMPDPQFDPLLGFSYCVFEDVCRTTTSPQLIFVTTLPVQNLSNENLAWVPDEQSLFEELKSLVKKSDPDILFGYDTVRLSWGYVLRRALVLGFLDFHQEIGRYPRGYQAPLDRHYDLPEDLNPPSGRLLRAVWRILRSELQLRSYDRGTAALVVLKRKLPILDDRAVCQNLFGKRKPRYEMVISYVNKLALLNISLLNEVNWFLKTAEMARVYGIQFHEVWSRGSQLRVESMMFRLAHTQGFVMPSVIPSQRIQMDAPEQLQLIMEPLSKVYFDPVIVLDFQSLYPSMMIAYNYCFSTLFGKVTALEEMHRSGESSIQIGAIKYTVPRSSFVECATKKMLHCSPLSAAFATHSKRSGILPTLLREVLGARIMVKSAMKHVTSKRLKRVLDARQLALKLVANVTYGYTSANFSGRMPCVEVADAILGKGRETLERAIAQVKEGNYGGAQVIYGDTDSMFVLVPGATKAEAFAIGRRIAEDITKVNPTPVVLKLEKVYMGCVLETKKRYAGWMYESEDDEKGQLDSKGLETIRRDTCMVVANVLERSLKLIFAQDWRALSTYLNTKLSRLEDLPYTDFVFSKEFRGHYTDNAPVPQLKVAMRLAAQNPAHIALVGERLPYIVTQGAPDASVISCVRSIPDFLADKSLQIHFTYYAHVHILPALRRVTDLLPLTINWRADASTMCFTPGCLTVGGNPWCSCCAEFGSTFRFALVSLAREERLQAIARLACSRCQQRIHCDMDQCQNYACSVKKVWNSLARSKSRRAVTSHRLYSDKNPFNLMVFQ
ncbi:hypothetical protein V3C99_001205 [Haemonchus contortus]